MLNFCGQPLVDVGLATLTALQGKKTPDQLSLEDLEKAADTLADIFLDPCMSGYLSIVFTMNAGYTQPGYSKTPEKKAMYAQKVLKAFLPDVPRQTEKDIFLGLPVVDYSFHVEEKGSAMAGRAFRQHIPLLTGEDVINFFPYGEAGIPVSGETLLAIQAFPLGSLKIGGKLLTVHSDNPEVTLYFARKFLDLNLKAIQLARQNKEKFSLEVPRAERTLLIEVLVEATQSQEEGRSNERPFSVTAYHFSNSGQGPALQIFHLPMQTVLFLTMMQSARYRNAWSKVVQRAWQQPPARKGGKGESSTSPKNYLYEDLFSLPENAAEFLRRYLLVIPSSSTTFLQPSEESASGNQAEPVNWEITVQFLRRILNMEKEKIEQIRTLADTLADYISQQNDSRFFWEFYTQNRYDFLRNALLKANLNHVRRGNPPLLQFDPYIQVFEEGYELPSADWKLARDLVLIRMVERLYRLNWFGTHAQTLPDLSEAENAS